MLDDYIQHTLAQVDDLAELKVSLVALRLLELKQSETASVTARELAALAALRDGLGFAPSIALDAALQRAVARGTLLRIASESLDEPRYFLNNEASRRTVEVIELSEAKRNAARKTSAHRSINRTLNRVAREIEWLEMIDVYAPTPADESRVEEWLAQGFALDELLRAVRETLGTPRPKGDSSRTLEHCAPALLAHAPNTPSVYYRSVVMHSDPAPDEIVAFRELAHRWPSGHEFNLVQAAVGIFGAKATIEMMKRVISSEHADVDALIPMLAEQEEAELALARAQVIPDLLLRQLIQLYETTFGLPPTSGIAQEISALAIEIKDVYVWQSVFQYATTQNKRDWAYVRKLLLNPSPSLFEPGPVNETAQFAFNQYKRRVSRGVLDPSVAREINEVAQRVTDQAAWTHAIDQAASANALNWNYIKKVLTNPAGSPGERTSEGKDGRRKQFPGTKQRGVIRRPQVGESTEEEREAARERARQRIAERAKRRTPNAYTDDTPPNISSQ